MRITLTCEKCKLQRRTDSDELYKIWKPKYDDYKTKKKAPPKKPTFFAVFSCTCGHVTFYNGPIIKFFFNIIFRQTEKRFNKTHP